MTDGGIATSQTIPFWKNSDLVGGLVLLIVAAGALWAVQDLPARQGFRFASGTAPRIFAYALGILGLAIAAQGFRKGSHSISAPAWRPALCIIGALVLFAVLIRPLGLLVTGIICVAFSSYATNDVRWKETLVFAVCITAFCVLVFPIGLNQPVPLWPDFSIVMGR